MCTLPSALSRPCNRRGRFATVARRLRSCAYTTRRAIPQRQGEARLKVHKRFEDLFEEGIETLYDAETQIVDALPKMMAASSSKELAIAFASHLIETRRHVTRLEDIFQLMGKEPRGRAGDAIRGLLFDATALIDGMEVSATLDLAPVPAARMVEQRGIV